MSKWRPKGFDAAKIAGDVLIERGIIHPAYWNSSTMVAFVEASADAILEALRQRGHHVNSSASFSSVGEHCTLSNLDNTGHYVFIPDDDAGGNE